MKVWLPVKGHGFDVRFLASNGWTASGDECATLCRQLNADLAVEAARQHMAAVVAARQRATEIDIIKAAGIDCTLPPVRIPGKAVYSEWLPGPVGHTSGWPDLPKDGRVWVPASPSYGSETEPEEDLENRDGLTGPYNTVVVEPGEWLSLSGISGWLPAEAIGPEVGEFSRAAYDRWVAAEEARWNEQVGRYQVRLQELEAVLDAGLQPTFTALPIPTLPQPKPTYDQWVARQLSPGAGRTNHIELTQVHP